LFEESAGEDYKEEADSENLVCVSREEGMREGRGGQGWKESETYKGERYDGLETSGHFGE
jgi:hypothetical protein